MRDLLALAASYGVHVHYSHLDDDTSGLYDHERRIVHVDIDCTPDERRSTLAHELGHVHYGDDCDDEAADRRADAFAARLLIDPAEYARLEQINHDAHWLAEEFRVTVDIIEDYRRYCLTALCGVTYTRPRHGFGQWAHRALRGAHA